MRTFFKTNINCIGCASQVKLHLDKLEQSKDIEHWNVHLNTPMSPKWVKQYVREAGFEAQFTRTPQA
jgi:hypothetical protein